MFRKFVALTCCFACLCFAGGGLLPAAAQDGAQQAPASRDDIIGPKPDLSSLTGLRFLTEGDYPPFNYFDDDGQLTGFNVDIARAICHELEVTCEVNATAWDNIVPSLKSKEADAAIASVAITAKSLTDLDFTDKYYETPARFASRMDVLSVKPSGEEKQTAAKTGSKKKRVTAKYEIGDVTPEALRGFKIAVVSGTSHEVYLRDFFPGSTIKPYKSMPEARGALKAGEADLLFGDVVSLTLWANGNESANCCHLLPGGFNEPKYFGEGVSIAVRRGNTELAGILNYGLAKIRASGRYEEIFRRYFPADFY
jgi:polar amino acid transport system substrate-binding protein